MLKRHALSAAKSEMHGRMLGTMAEEYHVNLPRRYLLDTVCLDQGDAEVDNTQGAINDDDLINIMITVRMRLVLLWLVLQGRVGGGEGGEGGGRSRCVYMCNKRARA